MLKWTPALSLLIALTLAGCGDDSSPNSSLSRAEADARATSAPPPQTPTDLAAAAMPPDQALYAKWQNEALEGASGAQNAIVSAQRREAFEKQWCIATKRLRTFVDWTGTVTIEDQSTDSGSHIAVIEVAAEPFGIRATASEGTALFATAATLKDGEPVRVSGAFDPSDFESDDCLPRVDGADATLTRLTLIPSTAS